MSMTFTKLFSSITDSSIWCQDDHTRLVWITMLAMADKHGRVWAAIPGLASRARVPVEAADRAIAIFLAPDPHSRTKDHDGRRIEPIDGGWRLLNHAKYRAVRDEEDQRAKTRERVRRFRAKPTGNADVTPCNARGVTVTRGNDNADADADADADQRQSAALPLVGAEKDEIPESLKTPEFLAAWATWQQHRAELRKPMKPTSRRALLEKLTSMGTDRAVIAISHSIANGWQGIFEPTEKTNSPDARIPSNPRNAGTY